MLQQLNLEGGEVLAFIDDDMLHLLCLQSVEGFADHHQHRQVLLPQGIVFRKQLLTGIAFFEEVFVKPCQVRQREFIPVFAEVFLSPGVDFLIALVPDRIQILDLLLPLGAFPHIGLDLQNHLLRTGIVPVLQQGGGGLDSLADNLFQFADTLLQREVPQVPEKDGFELLMFHERDTCHFEAFLRQDGGLQMIQIALQLFHHGQGTLEPKNPAGLFPLCL